MAKVFLTWNKASISSPIYKVYRSLSPTGILEYDGNDRVIPHVKIFRDTTTLLLNSGQSLSFFYRDADGDGFGNPVFSTQSFIAPEGFTADLSDCDDDHAGVYPLAPEICNNMDDNCDGIQDEASIPYFADADADGFGNPADFFLTFG